ncbi:MAG TPA: signal peptidase I, partial [Thioalkalivibrio sp.]|nr:signal peptidase I [Thioalkalivibrio sp.]
GMAGRSGRVVSRLRRPARTLCLLTVGLLMLHAFVVEPFRIPSGSMLPTLQVDDFVLVEKYAYGLRLPTGHTRLLDTGAPRRGDLAVFRHPHDPQRVSVKRVVGLPGDRLRYQARQLTINDQCVEQTPLGRYTGAGVTRYLDGAQHMEETLDGVRYEILVMPDDAARDIELVVPAGHYFTLGDNRDNSQDSRDWGVVPEANLVGRVFFTLRLNPSD